MTEPDLERLGRGRRWWLLAAGLVAAWSVYLVFFGPEGPAGGLGPPALKPPARPLRADFQWVLRDLDDRPVELARYKGRPIFLNLWATFCPPCLAEMPSIVNLAEARRLKDVVFLCVSTDQSASTVRSFLRERRWPLTILRATNLPDAFAADGLPSTFVIAPDGRIVVFEEGPAQWDDPSAVDFLEALARRERTQERP